MEQKCTTGIKKGCTNGQKGAKNVQNMTIMGHNRCKNLKWVNKGCRKGAWAVRRNLASKVFNLLKKFTIQYLFLDTQKILNY